MKSFFHFIIFGYTCCDAFILLSSNVPKITQNQIVKKVTEVASFEEEYNHIEYFEMGICRGGTCRVNMGIVEAVMDDTMDCISEYYEMVTGRGDEDEELYVFRCGGDD